MAKHPNTPDEAIKAIRKLLADWLEATDEASKPVAKIIRLLEIVEGGVHRGGRRERGAAAEDQATRYTIEKTPSGEVLTEGKGPGAPPFKVPKPVYDAVAHVLADSPKPLKFEDIMAAVAKKTAAPPGDFQIRVCLRFLMAANPPLIARTRAQYHAITPSSLAPAAGRLWSSISGTKGQ